MKKILLIFMAFMIFAYPVHTAMFPQQADAAVASKVASQAAKKIAKEVIVDEAINTAMNFALMEAIEIADNYQAKEGYKVVCPSGASTCDKPIQVKTTLSDSDKSALRGQTEIELEKAITGGKGLTKWQKFLDWFVPVWITSFALTALTYAIDPDARSLFNEIGYNALVALGFITPITTSEVIPLKEIDIEEVKNEPSNNTNLMPKRTITGGTSGWGNAEWLNLNLPPENMLFEIKILDWKAATGMTYTDFYLNGQSQIQQGKTYYTYQSYYPYSDNELTYALNGTTISTSKPSTGNVYESGINYSGVDLQREKYTSVITRLPYKVGDFWYTDMLFNTVDGKVIESQLRSQEWSFSGQSINKLRVSFATAGTISGEISVYQNVEPNRKILPPLYEEIEVGQSIMQKSEYEDDDGNMALIPPAAITYEEEATGEQVERKPNSTGDGYVFQKPDGTIVPEEQVHVPPTWEPNITPSPTPIPNPGGSPDPYPEGTPQITPSPTPSNPNPEPIPLTPSPTPQPEPNPETPPGTPPPPVETTEPYFPEGETCDVGLKIPKFLPLAHSISETFPFSIPFDLYGGFEALFIEMGSERPEFEFAFDFMGKEQSWTIAIPEYFDSWKPFTDSVLIFIFDVGIIYAIYRFMGGGS